MSRLFQSQMRLLVGIALISVASGCASLLYETLDAKQFHQLWEGPQSTGQYWRLMGEDDDYYYIDEGLIFNSVHYYRVSKKEVSISLGPHPQFPMYLSIQNEIRYLDQQQ